MHDRPHGHPVRHIGPGLGDLPPEHPAMNKHIETSTTRTIWTSCRRAPEPGQHGIVRRLRQHRRRKLTARARRT